MLGAMQREAGRQLVRKLASDDDLPMELRDDPTEGEGFNEFSRRD